MFMIPAIQRYYPYVRSTCRDTTLMDIPYAKRTPILMNFHHSCHSVQIYYPECTIRMQKESRSSWMFPFLPFRDTTLKYNPYAEILRWCTICIQKAHRSSLLYYRFELGCKYLIFYGTVDTVHVMLVSWCVQGTIPTSYFPLPRTVMTFLQRGKRPSLKPNPM